MGLYIRRVNGLILERGTKTVRDSTNDSKLIQKPVTVQYTYEDTGR
jgi:hypothetical protein